MRRLFKAVAGAIIMGAGSGAVAPVQAAPLDFSFTTVSGATGTFTLETDTTPSPEPANFGFDPITGNPVTGISYPNAVSNLFLSSAQVNLSGETADFEVAPTLTSADLGVPAGVGVLSGAVFPAGCSTGATFSCLFTLSTAYTGNLSELPQLSDDPASYPIGLSLDFFDPTTAQLTSRDFIPFLNVVRRQPVPESDSTLSVLAFAITSATLLLKRKMNKRVQPS
jgi:hypothetical protein